MPTSPGPTSPTTNSNAPLAEVDEDAWSALYSSISCPFPSPAHNGKPGKIVIKVINQYGDEVLKVYEVS